MPDSSFSQITEVEKREPRKRFLKPMPKSEARNGFEIPFFQLTGPHEFCSTGGTTIFRGEGRAGQGG